MSKEIVFDKDKFIRLLRSNIEHNSSSSARARQYLVEEGIDPDKFVQKSMNIIRELKIRNTREKNEEAQTFRKYMQKKRWTHRSVLNLIEESGNSDPLDEIRKRARSLVIRGFELGWEGPPYSAVDLAQLMGIEVMPSDSVADACIIPRGKGFLIQYNPFQKPTRINFSVSHEIAHTLLSDCSEAVRNRESEPVENRQLEQLCNAAAAEIQLPYAIFSHDANAASPSIEGLIQLATKYRASLESVFIRYTEVIDRPCAILMGVFQDEDKIVIDYHRSSRLMNFSLPEDFTVPKNSVAYECTSPGWTAREQIEWESFHKLKYNMFAIGISSYRKDKRPRVGLLVLPNSPEHLSPTAGKIALEIGDATKPRGPGKKIIAQVVNTSAALGRGFGYSLAKNYPIVKDELKTWHSNKQSFILGTSNLVKISKDLFVFQMLAQKGIFAKGNEIPLKYDELRKCLEDLRGTAQEMNCSIHMPAIGAGNAGGDWNIIIGMIHDELVNYDLKVNIYLLQGKTFNPREKTTLTIFKEDSTWETEK